MLQTLTEPLRMSQQNIQFDLCFLCLLSSEWTFLCVNVYEREEEEKRELKTFWQLIAVRNE